MNIGTKYPHKNHFCRFCCWKLTWTSGTPSLPSPSPCTEFGNNQVGLSPRSGLRTRTARRWAGCRTWTGRTAAPWKAIPQRPSPSAASRELSVGQRRQKNNNNLTKLQKSGRQGEQCHLEATTASTTCLLAHYLLAWSFLTRHYSSSALPWMQDNTHLRIIRREALHTEPPAECHSWK